MRLCVSERARLLWGESRRECVKFEQKTQSKKSYKQKTQTINKIKKHIYVCCVLAFLIFQCFFCSTITGTLWDSLGCTGRTKTLLGRFTLSESSEERSYVSGSLKIPIWGLIDRSQGIKAAEGRGGALSPAYMARFLILLLFAFALFFWFWIWFLNAVLQWEWKSWCYVTLCWVLFVFCFIFGFAFNVNIHEILFNITFSKTLQDTVDRDALRDVALRYALCYCSVICYMT